MQTILKRGTEVDFTEIEYGTIKDLGSQRGSAIYVNMEGKALVLQTPKMRSPFGLSKYEDKDKETGEVKSTRYDVQLSFDHKEDGEDIEQFLQNMRALDEKLISDGTKNSKEWLGKKMGENSIKEAAYTSVVRVTDKEDESGNPLYAPTIKIKVPYYDDKFKCEFYDNKRNELNQEQFTSMLRPGVQVQALIQCVGIWITNKKFGCSWKLVQMRIFPSQSLKKHAFLDDDGSGSDGSDGDNKQDDGDDNDSIIEDSD
jgi:hypothetical protein